MFFPLRAAVQLSAAIIFSAASWASVEPPNGWTQQRDESTIYWNSPNSGDGKAVLLVIGDVERTNQPMDQWFEGQVADLIKQGAAISNRNGQSRQEDLTKDVFDIVQEGNKYRAFAFAYDTPLGKQMILVMTLGALDVNDPTLQLAFDTVARLWRQRVANRAGETLVAGRQEGVYRPAQTGSPAPTPSPQPSTGGRCREELRTITTMELQRVCYPSAGGMMNCQLQSAPVQREVYQTQCY